MIFRVFLFTIAFSIAHGIEVLEKPKCQAIEMKDLSWSLLKLKLLDSKNSIQSVEDLLCILPEEYRESYVLSHRSRSIQESSFSAPRAILFDKIDPTKLILSFNGDPTHAGFKNVEVIYKTNESPSFMSLADIDFSTSLENGPVITENPPKCLACHGTQVSISDRRLLFDANPIWDGFYGLSLFHQIPRAEVLKQQRKFEEFQSEASSHPRYKFLVDLDKKITDDRFLKEPIIREPRDAEAQLAHKEFLEKKKQHSMNQTNKIFTMSLAKHNHRRLAEIIPQTEHYSAYKFAIFAALSGCGDIPSYLTPKVRSWHDNDAFLVDELRGINRENFVHRHQVDLALRIFESSKGTSSFNAISDILNRLIQAMISKPLDLIFEKFSIDSEIKQENYGASSFVISDMRYLMEARRSPVKMMEWNIDIDKGFYRFNNNDRVDFDLTDVAPLLREKDPELRDYTAKGQFPFVTDASTPEVMDQMCQSLKNVSLERFGDFEQKIKITHSLTQSQMEKSLLTGKSIVDYTCMKCHSEEAQFAPTLPFNSSRQMAEWDLTTSDYSNELCRRLNLDLDDHYHMPKFFNLEKSQMQLIVQYYQENAPSFRCSTAEDK